MKDYGWLDAATARPLTGTQRNVGSAQVKHTRDLPSLLINAEQIVSWIYDKLHVLMSNINDIDLTNVFETRLLLNRVEHDIKQIAQFDIGTLRSRLSRAVDLYQREHPPKMVDYDVDKVARPIPYPNTTSRTWDPLVDPTQYHTINTPDLGGMSSKQDKRVPSYNPLADVDIGEIDDD